ncbi:Clavaminate synthase-like protein [Laetiporus sulphureus 93-53]|uniref:Clavaminate synthase-like protein n=1 Tax=Laetiporus sulphureus 93-53 TaxID=1314785 RepID=A0A165IBZ1_9APHY|nr:Clavaminate synthase-like protein [Laetiporus sulphureus 93-53]KZT12868.1 Clavaminate synthase-like protein [Laetiporus sulphureus 93-53]
MAAAQQYAQQAVTNEWQMTERASVRLAARGSIQMPMHASQRPQPTPPSYYATHVAFAAAVPYPHPIAVQKRILEQPEEETPKSKKAKTKAKAAEGTAVSRRGYNAKKRSEAAQIAAQNAQLMPTVSYAHVSVEKGKERSTPGDSMRLVSSEDGLSHTESSGPLHPELQFARCMSNRYRSEEFPRCVSCTRRWAGDTCRFQGIRFFLKNDKKNIVGVSFVESQKPDSPTMNFPAKWNIPLEKSHIRRVKRTVAQALLPTLKKELEHLGLSEIIRRPRESEVRATCDTCMTSIFSCSWMCRLCGREACAECYEQVKELTIDKAGAPEAEIAALQARRERHAHINPFFLSCTRRNEHQAKDFSPMSRFCKAELSEAIREMEALLQETESQVISPELGSIDAAVPAPVPSTAGISGASYAAPRTFSESIGTGVPPEPSSFAASALSPVQSMNGLTSVLSHDTLYFAEGELSDDIFRRIWKRGEPLVVTGLLRKFHVQWTPEYFLNKYSSQSCLILECQTDQNKRVTVGEFFSWFGKYEGRRDCWKLKDWPPSTDFRTAFPELYDDFSNATPVPNYVRRDGVLNMASHFPSNTVAPDLGPKMYNAMASFESQGSKGSTRLHMDMADAINIMLHAEQTPDGRPGCAAWDLFRAEDAPKLRKFLKKKFKGQFQHDPIHSQQFYLDSTLRRELFKDYGVKSHRVYQKPGEAVFIPAGCAHQVCNLADCIKVACDFVSPENIDRCEMLTREFREQNQSMAWKEDVLQLRTMMWFAWLSCRRQEKDMES